MSALPSNLLSRLRRHLRVVALLFVGLMVLKAGFATACAADSLAVPPAAVALMDGADGAGAEPQATHLSETASENCWHAGAGGCHCACVHVTPLQPQSLGLMAAAASPVRFIVAPAAVRLTPRDDHLRPPIA